MYVYIYIYIYICTYIYIYIYKTYSQKDRHYVLLVITNLPMASW